MLIDFQIVGSPVASNLKTNSEFYFLLSNFDLANTSFDSVKTKTYHLKSYLWHSLGNFKLIFNKEKPQ